MLQGTSSLFSVENLIISLSKPKSWLVPSLQAQLAKQASQDDQLAWLGLFLKIWLVAVTSPETPESRLNVRPSQSLVQEKSPIKTNKSVPVNFHAVKLFQF